MRHLKQIHQRLTVMPDSEVKKGILKQLNYKKVDDLVLGSVLNQNVYAIIRQKQRQGSDIIMDRLIMEGTWMLLDLLAVYGTIGPNVFDADKDQDVDTWDLMLFLAGLKQTRPPEPSFNDLTVFATYGEGNSWLAVLQTPDTLDIDFAWLHRTPFDEPGEPNDTYNLNSFELDIIWKSGIVETLTYLKR